MRKKMRKLMVFSSVLAILLTAGFVQGADLFWDGGGTGDLWTTAGNWNPDGVPVVGDTATINGGGTALIDGTVTSTVDRVNLSTDSATDGTLTMTGGSLTNLGQDAQKYPMTVGSKPGGVGTFNLDAGAVVSPGFLIGNSFGSEGIVNMTGGSIDARKSAPLWPEFWEDFAVGDAGTGTLSMSDGTIQANNLGVPRRNGHGDLNMTGGTIDIDGLIKVNQMTSSGTSMIQLDGGTITADGIELYSANSQVDITGTGMLVIREDGFWNPNYIVWGRITGNGGVVGDVNVFQNPTTGYFELTAIPEPATVTLLGLGGLLLSLRRRRRS